MVLSRITGLRGPTILVCAIAALAQGQDSPRAEPPPPAYGRFANGVRSGFVTLVRDEALLWSSPARARGRDWKLILPWAAITGAALGADRRLTAALPNSADQIRYSKGVSVAGTYYSLGAASAAFAGIGALTKNRRAVETGLIAAQAIAHSESIAQMLKFAAGRERPDCGSGEGGRFWRRQQSFPSGHAMGTWAVATVISKEYHDNPLIRNGVYALPVLVSASRIGARRHFLADVMAGGALGYMIGGWLYRRHHDPGLGGAAVPARGFSVKPGVGYDRRRGGVSFALEISR